MPSWEVKMIDLGLVVVFVWLGCFGLVAVDSALLRLSPVFWRLAALFGGPFVLLAYGIVRELVGKKRAA
jgi:hypothetical protein